MKSMLMRPTAALFPAILLISALAGSSTLPLNLYFCWILAQICTLCSVDAFRNAAAREPGVRRVDRRFSGAWLPVLLGCAIAGAVVSFISGSNNGFSDWICLVIAAAGILIEQLFEERMFALSRNADGVVLSVISNALLMTGMLLDHSGGISAPAQMTGFFTACAAGLGMVISIAVNYFIEPMRGFSLKPANIAFAPMAAVHSLVYPLVGMALTVRAYVNPLPNFNLEGPAIFCGLALWRLSRTVCRRSPDESRKLNLLLICACAVLMIAGNWLQLRMYALTAVIAMLCAEIVYCAPGWRLYAGTAMILAAIALQIGNILPEMWNMAAVSMLCIAAVILNLHKAFLKKV